MSNFKRKPIVQMRTNPYSNNKKSTTKDISEANHEAPDQSSKEHENSEKNAKKRRRMTNYSIAAPQNDQQRSSVESACSLSTGLTSDIDDLRGINLERFFEPFQPPPNEINHFSTMRVESLESNECGAGMSELHKHDEALQPRSGVAERATMNCPANSREREKACNKYSADAKRNDENKSNNMLACHGNAVGANVNHDPISGDKKPMQHYAIFNSRGQRNDENTMLQRRQSKESTTKKCGDKERRSSAGGNKKNYSVPCMENQLTLTQMLGQEAVSSSSTKDTKTASYNSRDGELASNSSRSSETDTRKHQDIICEDDDAWKNGRSLGIGQCDTFLMSQMTQEDNSIPHNLTQYVEKWKGASVQDNDRNTSIDRGDQSDDENEGDFDLPACDLQQRCLDLSQSWKSENNKNGIASSPNSSAGNRDNIDVLEYYDYKPSSADVGGVGPRRYELRDRWCRKSKSMKEDDVEKIYTIVGFQVRKVTTKCALCKVMKRLSKTFLGDKSKPELEKVWIEEAGEVLVRLKDLNWYVPAEWPTASCMWESNNLSTCRSADRLANEPEKFGFSVPFEFAYTHKSTSMPSRKIVNERPNVLELFAGAGGMSRGLERAGFAITAFVENDYRAEMTLKVNFGKGKRTYCECVNDFLENCRQGKSGYPRRGDFNHLHASTPCQGYSGANRVLDGGKNGQKNRELIFSFVEAIRIFQPDTASFENVSGLLAQQHVCYLKEVVSTLFFDLGCNVRVCLLNAAEYGDPQIRHRVFLFASRKGLCLPRAPIPTHGRPGSGLRNIKTVKEAIGHLAQISPQPGSGIVELGGIQISNHSSDGTSLRSEVTVLEADKPVNTLFNQSTNALVHYEQGDRGLSIRELALLQSFPDDHEFPSNRNVARKLIYNAVPGELAHAVAKSVMGSYCVDS